MKRDRIFILKFFLLFIIFIPSLVSAKKTIPEEEDSFALNGKGVEAYSSGEFDKARKNFFEGLKVATLYLDPITSAILVNNIACTDLKETYSPLESEDTIRSVYSSLITYDQPALAVIALNNLAVLDLRGGRLDSAIEKFKKVEQYQGTHLNLRGEGIALNNLAICYRKKGQFDKAILSVNKAISIFESEPYENGLANAYYNKGMIYLDQKNPEIAIGFFTLALKYDKKSGDKFNLDKTRDAINTCKKMMGGKSLSE